MHKSLYGPIFSFLLGKDLRIELVGHMARKCLNLKESAKGFPGGAVVKNPPANAGDTGSIPGPGRSHMLRNN